MLDKDNISPDVWEENKELLEKYFTKQEFNRQRGRKNRAKGEASEGKVKKHLIALGLRQVQRIETGWKVLFDRQRKPYSAWPIDKVLADYTAIMPDGSGRFVICEAKSRPGSLPFSALEAQQVKALIEYHALNAIALLAWHDSETEEVYIMQWPVFGKFHKTKPACNFGPYMAINPEIAQENLFTLESNDEC